MKGITRDVTVTMTVNHDHILYHGLENCRTLSYRPPTLFSLSIRDRLRWVYSLLSSGLLSSTPTPPSNEESIFSETGTNKEVSGGLGVEVLEEKFLKQIPESACCLLCMDTTPPDSWLLPAQVQAARELKWRWRRKSNREQRFADMAVSPGCKRLRWRATRSDSVTTWVPCCSTVERFK